MNIQSFGLPGKPFGVRAQSRLYSPRVTSQNTSNASLTLNRAKSPAHYPSAALSKVYFGYTGNVSAWSGMSSEPIGFHEYHDMAMTNPRLTRTPFQLISDMMEEAGTDEGAAFGKKVTTYRFFTQPKGRPNDAVIGNEKYITDIVRYFKEGANGLPVSERMLLLWGPHGSAKTTIIRNLMNGLEDYTNSEAGKLFTFRWQNLPEDITAHLPKGIVQEDGTVPDDLHSDPLLAIPREFRDDQEKELTRNMELPPLSRMIRNQLMAKYIQEIKDTTPDLDKTTILTQALEKTLDHMKVERFLISTHDRRGIGRFKAQDGKTVDESQLWGAVNYNRLASIGRESDPRVFELRGGAFFDANRGLCFSNEPLKMLPDGKPIFVQFLEVMAERVVTPPKMPAIDVNEVNIADANIPEMERVRKDKDLHALLDRTKRIRIPYLIEYPKEASIYEKSVGSKIRKAGYFVAPHTMEAAALWAILTRLKLPKQGQGEDRMLLTKARAYAGENVSPQGGTAMKQGQQAENTNLLQNWLLEGEKDGEGMEGVSPRNMQDLLSRATSESFAVQTKTLDAIQVMDVIEEAIEKDLLDVKDPDKLARLGNLAALAKEDLNRRIKDDVITAMSGNKDEMNRLFANYINNCIAHVNREKLETTPGVFKEPDQEFMTEVEKFLPSGTTSSVESWRSSVVNKASRYFSKAMPYTYDENGDVALKEAIAKLLASSNDKKKIDLAVLLEACNDNDRKEQVRKDPIIGEMMKMGYNEVSAIHALQRYYEIKNAGSAEKK